MEVLGTFPFIALTQSLVYNGSCEQFPTSKNVVISTEVSPVFGVVPGPVLTGGPMRCR